MDIRFTADHEWIALDGDTAQVGITDHAQSLLGDLVFVELPRPALSSPLRHVAQSGHDLLKAETARPHQAVTCTFAGSKIS